MYKYVPKPKKIREKIIMSVCLLLSALSYGVSSFLPYPALYQLFTVVSLTAAVLIIVRYLLRDYVYCICEDENGDAYELVVVEIMGKKQTVVCQILLENVGSVYSRQEFAEGDVPRKSNIYRYVSELFPEDGYFVRVLDGEKNFFIQICADMRLLELIKSRKPQEMSDI